MAYKRTESGLTLTCDKCRSPDTEIKKKSLTKLFAAAYIEKWDIGNDSHICQLCNPANVVRVKT